MLSSRFLNVSSAGKDFWLGVGISSGVRRDSGDSLIPFRAATFDSWRSPGEKSDARFPFIGFSIIIQVLFFHQTREYSPFLREIKVE
jgi:hypothetical protein